MPRAKKKKNQEEEVQQQEDSSVQADFRVKGSPEKVRDAMKQYGGDREDRERENNSKEKKIAKELSNPNHIVVVRRLQPKEFNGERTRCEVYREQCPLSLQEIKSTVFQEHGGHKYQLRVLDADDSTVAAINFENPDTEDPLIQTEEVPMPDGFFTNDDPPDAYDKMEEELQKQLTITQKKQAIEQLKETLEEMKTKKRSGDTTPKEDSRMEILQQQVSNLQRGLEDMVRSEREEKLMSKISELEKRIQNPSSQEKNSSTEMILAFLKSSQEQQQSNQAALAQQFQASQGQMAQIMQAIMQSNQAILTSQLQGSQKDNFDGMLEKMAKMKTVLGAEDKSKGAVIEDMMYDLVIDKIKGGDTQEPEDEDVMKYAIKQLTPVLKEYAQKTVQKKTQEGGQQPSPDEIKQAVSAEAKRLAHGALMKWQQEQAVRQGQALPQGGTPQPAPKKPEAPSEKGKQKASEVSMPSAGEVEMPSAGTFNPEEMKKEPKPSGPVPPRPQVQQVQDVGEAGKQQIPEPGAHESDESSEPAPGMLEEEDGPPGPQSPAYNRKTTVNWILDNVLKDIKDRIPHTDPTESYVVGDCIDYLDDKVLTDMLSIDDGEGLEKLLLKHGGEKEKIQKIKDSGEKDQTVKRWLNRVIVSVQEEYESKLKQSKATSVTQKG